MPSSARVAAGVGEGAIERLARKVVEAAFEVAAEDGHGDAGDVDTAHVLILV
jgi:hypothetical protein